MLVHVFVQVLVQFSRYLACKNKETLFILSDSDFLCFLPCFKRPSATTVIGLLMLMMSLSDYLFASLFSEICVKLGLGLIYILRHTT